MSSTVSRPTSPAARREPWVNHTLTPAFRQPIGDGSRLPTDRLRGRRTQPRGVAERQAGGLRRHELGHRAADQADHRGDHHAGPTPMAEIVLAASLLICRAANTWGAKVKMAK